MKQKCISFLLLFTLLLTAVTGCGSTAAKDSPDVPKEKVVLNEVAHSIFYAPMYVAIEEGYFQEEGLEVELVTGFGADKTMTAVLSGEADIGFMGSEASIYTYLGGTDDPVVNFAQLTQRAGNFLVSRQPIDNFSWDMLKGAQVLGGRAGGMPDHNGTSEHIRGIYAWTSRKALKLSILKYEKKIISSDVLRDVSVGAPVFQNNIRYILQAQNGLDETWKYICFKLCNPQATENTVNIIMDTVDELENFSETGAALPSVTDPESDYRFLTSGNHIIFYRMNGQNIYIDYILYVRRDYLRILFPDLPQNDNEEVP